MPAISPAIGAEPELQRPMGGHAVGFVHGHSVKQIMVKIMIVIIFFRPGVEANSRDRCLATQAFHMKRGLMISNASSLVNLKIALGAFEMAIQRLPSFPGQLGDNIDLGTLGSLATMAPTSCRI